MFVTMGMTLAAARISHGFQDQLHLGNCYIKFFYIYETIIHGSFWFFGQ